MLRSILLSRRWLLLLFVLSLPLEASFASATAQDVHDMVDICTNLHRVQKDYALVGMGVRYDKPADSLKATISKLDQEFQRLVGDHHLSAKLEGQIEAIQREWESIRQRVTAPPVQSEMAALHKQIENLTKRCLSAAEALAEDSHIEGEHYAVASAELGMEVQRLAALYLMRTWQVAPADYDHQAEHILQLFEKTYTDLHQADTRFVSAEAKAQLTEIETQFQVFEHMAVSKSGRFVPSLAQRSANQLFTQTNQLNEKIRAAVER